ncbi:MAG: hypothetical protein JNK38_17530 [Acidobacteria bacterium]|nr:hypothetical protein [Acidobacteriota bacterium]
MRYTQEMRMISDSGLDRLLNSLTLFNFSPTIFLGRLNAPPYGKFHDVFTFLKKLALPSKQSAPNNRRPTNCAALCSIGKTNFFGKILNWLELSKKSGVYVRNYTVMIVPKYSEDT